MFSSHRAECTARGALHRPKLSSGRCTSTKGRLSVLYPTRNSGRATQTVRVDTSLHVARVCGRWRGAQGRRDRGSPARRADRKEGRSFQYITRLATVSVSLLLQKQFTEVVLPSIPFSTALGPRTLNRRRTTKSPTPSPS